MYGNCEYDPNLKIIRKYEGFNRNFPGKKKRKVYGEQVRKKLKDQRSESHIKIIGKKKT